LATALGVTANKNGYSFAHFVLDDQMHVLKADMAPHPLTGAALLQLWVAITDEIGIRPLHRIEADLIFRPISTQHERGSMPLTSNKPVHDRPEIFAGDEALTITILDRLLHHLAVVHVDGQTFRLRALGAPLSPIREGPRAETTRSV
jgi:DNA replication protein DnaC